MAPKLSIRILIVDDSKSMLKIMHDLLRQIGFSNIVEATDAESAMTKLKEGRFDLILADLNDEAGEENLKFLKDIRGDMRLKTIPYVMIVKDSTRETVLAAKEAGVNSYIIKPLNAEILKSRLVSIIGNF